MRPVWALTIYLAAVFVGGGLLAPWFYWAANGTGVLDPANVPPFHRFVNRSMLVVGLAGLWPFAHYCRLDSWRSVGLKREPGWPGAVGKGFLIGFTTIVTTLHVQRRLQFVHEHAHNRVPFVRIPFQRFQDRPLHVRRNRIVELAGS